MILEKVINGSQINPFAKSATAVSFRISPQKITHLLAVFASLLIIAGIVAQSLRLALGEEFMREKHLWWLMDKFDLDGEFNVPNLYQTLLLFLCVGLLLMIAQAAKKSDKIYVQQWRCLSLFFVYLACDEGVELHEMTIKPLRQIFGTSGFFYYAWVILAAMMVPIFAALYFRFLMDLPAKFRWLFLSAGGLFITGAAGMEMIGGYVRNVYGLESPQYVAETIMEESLEMAGILIFIYALLSYLSLYIKEFQFQFIEPKS